MKHFLSILALAIATMGCSKHDSPEPPPPSPSLEGSWTEDSYTDLQYDADGNIISQASFNYPQYPAYITFTSTTRSRFSSYDHHAIGGPISYTLVGNVLTLAGATAGITTTIKQLTATALTIRNQHPATVTSQGSYMVYEQHYVRR